MANDGKALEELVALVERTLGAKIELRKKDYTDVGDQLAEFDVVARGRVGSANMSWLFQCRDRPSEGASSGEWIEQLATRRQVHGFDRVIAVSTQGFSPSAHHIAERTGVELREVKALTAGEFGRWLLTNTVGQFRECHLDHREIASPCVGELTRTSQS